ncbi:MAG: DUF47 family protein [Gemmatimonadetes bacterium]|nr:DUF47 family protein [Gemmatimonadota bacterium]
MRILPKDRALYGMLGELAGLLTDAARNLANSFDGPSSDDALRNLRIAESRADQLAIEINVRADRALVPPIDAEDVHALVLSLDAIVDQAEDVAETLKSHELALDDPPVQRVVRLLEGAGTHLAHAVNELETPRRVLDHTRQVHVLRDEANEVLGAATSALFDGGADPLEVVKRMSLYSSLERALQLSADAAHALERVAVKEL